MNPKPAYLAGDRTASEYPQHSDEDEAQEKGQSKKAVLQKKCDDIMESLASFSGSLRWHSGVTGHIPRTSGLVLRNELQQLEDAIPDLEKKSIKSLKLAGTLTAVENEGQKAKV